MEQNIKNTLNRFKIIEEIIKIEPFGEGHINETYLIHCNGGKQYILQRINNGVFCNVDELMQNVVAVTAYLHNKVVAMGGDPARECMQLIYTEDGASFVCDENGRYWRVLVYIENSVTLQTVEKPIQFYNSARAFGRFQRLLGDYPVDTLHEVISHFHDTALRYTAFEKAVNDDVCGRAESVKDEIAFVRAREKDTHVVVDLLAEGKLPLRVTHNDTKLNNVMLDDKTQEPLAVIDLDTVMPGSSLYDFGDSIRFGASHAAEDERDLSKVYCDLLLFEEYVRGYMEECRDILTQREIDLLPFSAKLLSLECGMRFLADYLNGDTYFRISYKDQNRDRCRTQFAMVADIEKKMTEMQKIVSKYC